MGERQVSLKVVLGKAVESFKETFGCNPTSAGYAPGRVNLIGEHTDYNDGFVLPIALNLATIVVGRANGSDVCHVKTTNSTDEDVLTEFSSSKNLIPGKPSWANYVKGVVANFNGEIKGFDAVISSTVPIGGGLSSSAALEVATYTFLEALFEKSSSPTEKALACQKAEHTFAQTPCGIMDQFISILAQKDNALLIDCMDLTSKLVPMNIADHTFLITNSNVKHSLMSGEYGARRSQCEEAAKLLGVKSLRFASLDLLFASEGKLPEVVFRRARHVITEIKRTQEAAEALSSGDLTKFGKLMNESHRSLNEDFEVSCPELNTLVLAAQRVEGVRGSRMTGGGFGGCTVTLVHSSAVETLKTHIQAEYEGSPTFYTASPSQGAYIIDLSLQSDL